MPRQPKKPIEQVISELGRYPMEAFVFVQECIGLAAEQVHGNMSADQMAVANWMTRKEIDFDELRSLADRGQLPLDIADALRRVGGPEKMNRHVTGQQLCFAVRDAARKQWGLMAQSVLARWRVTRTQDIGAIIFALVDSDWLQKQPTDRVEDFDDVFSFAEAFDQAYQIDGG